jgi:histidinol phosphatase-like enzyme (inositol monophosphatase family)
MKSRLDLAVRLAREAGNLTLRYFRDEKLQVERKDDSSPVTVADREAELLIRGGIEEVFPDDAVLGEEFPEKKGSSGYRWILDPIDGTKSFIHGVPLYSTLIGVEYEGEPKIGVIQLPAMQETVWAAENEGAWYHSEKEPVPKPAKVGSCERLAESLFLTSEVITFDEMGRREAYVELERACRLTRTWGDAYGYFLIVTGRADLMVDAYMSAWDAGPMLTILREAGGVFTDWQGNPTIHGGEGIGTNPALLEKVLSITRKYPKKSSL